MRIANDILEHPAFLVMTGPGNENFPGRWMIEFRAVGHSKLKVQKGENVLGHYRSITAPTLPELLGKAAEFLRVYDAEVGPPRAA